MQVRVGIGFDSHKLTPGRRLVLGGVQIHYAKGLAGHSDADVVLHAVCDALLGAAGLPDIGELFPDDNPNYRDADSRDLLREVLDRVETLGFGIGNVDLIIHADQPRLTPHKSALRESIAALLAIEKDLVSIKAKTMEGLAFPEVIACTCVVALVGS